MDGNKMIASTQTNHPLTGAIVGKTRKEFEEQVSAQLRNAGLRITQPRIAILHALHKRAQPSSIEQIFKDLTGKSCDLVTIYRCLSAFENIGLVRRTFFLNGTSLYALNLDDANRYHVVNKSTREIQALDAQSAAELHAVVRNIEERLRQQGYTNVSHVVEFFADTPTVPNRAQSPIKIS